MQITAEAARRSNVLGWMYGLLAALALALLAAQPAAAQQAAPTAYDDQDLEAFAAAADKVQQLNQKWIPQIAEAESPDEDQQMRERAMQEMEAAVRGEGLTIEEYNSIYDAAQRDPQVMQRIEQHLNSE